ELKVLPVDNDITKVTISTSYESFFLDHLVSEQDHIYFEDDGVEDDDIRLNSTFYDIIGTDFSYIPVEVKLYQGTTLITSKQVVIIVTDTSFEDPVQISGIEVDVGHHYPGTFSFTDDKIGQVPDEWVNASNCGGGEITEVITSREGHSKILKLYHPDTSGGTYVYCRTPSHYLVSGTYEWWQKYGSGTHGVTYILGNPYAHSNLISLTADTVYWREGSTQHSNSGYTLDWHHFKYQFDYSTDKFSLWVDGVLLADNKDMYETADTSLNLRPQIDGSNEGVNYWDAIGFSWDTEYRIGHNIFSTNLFDISSGFEGENVGTKGANIDFIGYSSTAGNTEIIAEFNEHKKVLSQTNTGGSDMASHYFTATNSGVIEFWLKVEDATKATYYTLKDTSNNKQHCHLRIYNDKFQYNSGGGWIDINGISDNVWYHMKYRWYSDNTWDCCINNIKVLDGVNMYEEMISGINEFYIRTEDTTSYYDAVGFSFDENYCLGSNQEVEIQNIQMSFANGFNAYNNSHGIPFVVNNNPPVVKLYSSDGYLTESIQLRPNYDKFDMELYNTGTIDIIDNHFIVSLPSPTSGEVCSIEKVWVNWTQYEFSYLVNNDGNLFIQLLTQENVDGTYGSSYPILVEYGISTGVKESQQFVTSFDFASLPQDEYTVVGEFYDLTGAISTFQLNESILVDFEGPYIYKQFGGISNGHYYGTDSFEAYPNSYYGKYYGTESFEGYTTDYGTYYGTYDFRDDEIGAFPDGEGWTDYFNDGCNVRVIAEKDGHNKVVELSDNNDTDGRLYFRNAFDNIYSGIVNIEYWMYPTDLLEGEYYYFRIGGSGSIIRIYYNVAEGYWTVSTGNGSFYKSTSVNTWTHFRVQVDLDTKKISVWINSELTVDSKDYWYDSDYIYYMFFETTNERTGVFYVDAIGYSWDTTSHDGLGYTDVGMNINSYDVEELLEKNWWYNTIDTFNYSINVENKDGHQNTLFMTHNGTSGAYLDLGYTFDSSSTTGDIEFWFYIPEWSGNGWDNGMALWGIYTFTASSNGYLYTYYNSTTIPLIDYSIYGAWHHLRISYDGADLMWYVDGILEYTIEGYTTGASSNIRVRQWWSATYEGREAIWIDGFGYSWDSNYDSGDNCNPYGKMQEMRDNGWVFSYDPFTSYAIVEEIDGHKKVLRLEDNSADNTVYMRKDFSSQIEGVIEFWFMADSDEINDKYWIRLKGSTEGPLIRYYQNQLYYYDLTGAIQTICLVDQNRWYHISINFDCTTDRFDFYLDGQLQGSGGYEFRYDVAEIDRIHIDSSTYQAYNNAVVYFDGIGVVGDNGYEAGMNRYPQGFITPVNPNSGFISFIVEDVSGIVDYYFDVAIQGYWQVSGDTYTFYFNDTSIQEGLIYVQFTCEDALGYTNSIDFALLLDRSNPTITPLYKDPEIASGLYTFEIFVDDLSEYDISLKVVDSDSGTVFNNLECTIIELESNIWQIIFDTSQLPDGYYDIYVIVVDNVGNSVEALIDPYFDNTPPEIESITEIVYADGENIYNNTISDTLYFNDEEYIIISAFDETSDDFNWNLVSDTLGDQLGVNNITMYYTNPLAWYNISIAGSLNYEQFIYEITAYGDPLSYDVQNIKGIQALKIGDYIIEHFNVLLDGTSLLIQIDNRYRYLLSSQFTDEIYAQFYELLPGQELVLDFDNSIDKWKLLSPSLNYFNISQHFSLVNGSQFLWWFVIEDGLGNKILTHKITGVYDNHIAQDPADQNLYYWSLGTNSTGSGIIIFGSDKYLDSTVQVETSSILHTVNDEEDVARIYIYGSEDEVDWDFIGRAYYSGEVDLWNYYWDGDALDPVPPENYNLKIILFDRAGNYLNQSHSVKLFDYTQIQLLTNLVFGHVFEYNSSLPSNEQELMGVIENYFGTTEVWDVIAAYYNPLEKAWVPMATDPTTILSNGSYTITWDINEDLSFINSMYNFSYEYLPMQVAPAQGSDLWGSWGTFSASEEWKPIIISEVTSNLDISVYKFDTVNGWELDSQLSNEATISSIQGQVFKLFDINKDSKYEIIRISSSQIDVIYLDGSSNWVIKENVTALSGYEYFAFDISYDRSSSDTAFVITQKDSSEQLSLWRYRFDTDFDLIKVKESNCPDNFEPNAIKIENYFSASDRKAILVAGLITNSYYSQLVEFDFNFNIKYIIVDAILGKISIVEYNEINGADTIILGIERLAIGKMDAVISLKRKTGTEEWVEFEISGFDDIKFEILDLLTIHENYIRKLIIASKTGLFQTKITHLEDMASIVSPVCFTTKVYSKQQLSPANYPIIIPERIPIHTFNKISYRLTGSNQWQTLSQNNYRYSRNEIHLDLSSVWSTLVYVKIAYSFESFVAEERSVVDPSFQSYSGASDTQSVSASGMFFKDASLPMIFLNPATSFTEPNWLSLPNGLTYQYQSVVSGLGNKVFYPTIHLGWDYDWGTEYTNMVELQNALINYGDSYDSGQLSQYLNSMDDYYGESLFGGKYQNNYIDNVWVSNPYISENYNFTDMYYPDIHDSSSEGLYNFYDGSQYVLIDNRLVDLSLYNADVACIYDTGSLPTELTPHNLSSVTWGLGGAHVSGQISDTWDDDNNYYRMKSTNYYNPKYPIDIEVLSAYLHIPSPGYEGNDFYLSIRVEFEVSSGSVYVNGEIYEEGMSIELDRVFIEDVNSIKILMEEEEPHDMMFANLYYFKVEKLSSSSPAVQGASMEELEYVLSNWSKYMSTYRQDYGIFGFENTYKLPVVSKDSIESLQLAFDASISSPTFAKDYPLSIQLWNYEQNRWESIPLAPLDGTYTYDNEKLFYDFWRWDYDLSEQYYRKKITVDHNKAISNQYNFPLAIELTDTDIKNKAQADGDDIYFTSSDGVTKLAHEIEHYNPSTGKLIAWVKIPTLYSSTDTVIYIYYGNPNSENQENPQGVWSDYKGVYHLNENTGDATDSTSLSNDLTLYNTPTQGVDTELYKGYDFDGSSEFLYRADDDDFDFGTGWFTISAWVKTSDTAFGVIVSKTHSGDNVGYSLDMNADGTVRFVLRDSSTYMATSTKTINDGNWHHVAGIRNSIGDIYCIVDETYAYKSGCGVDVSSNKQFRVANRHSSSYPLEATIDEVRASHKNLFLSQMYTRYRIEKDPELAISLGSEQNCYGIGNDDRYRPKWSTVNSQSINTISYGDNFPNTVDGNGYIVVDESVKDGASFLDNSEDIRTINNSFFDNSLDSFKFLTYDATEDANKFQLDNLLIDVNNFYTTTTTFPSYKSTQSFTSADFYDDFLNDLHEFKIRIITEKESEQASGEKAYLCIGDLNTYVHTNTSYLNYDEFESNAIQGHHISDKLLFTDEGIKLYGFSGFNIKEPPKTLKFRDNFESTLWNLLGASQNTITFKEDIVQDSVVRDLFPDTNYNGQDLCSYSIANVYTYYIPSETMIHGSKIESNPEDMRWDDDWCRVYESDLVGSDHIIEIETFNSLDSAKRWTINYDMFTDKSVSSIKLYTESGVIDEVSGTTLSGSAVVENVEELYIKTVGSQTHELHVDLLEHVSVPEEYETFIQVPLYTKDYLVFGDNDKRELELSRPSSHYYLNPWIYVYSSGAFNEQSLTWNNRPPIYDLLSQTDQFLTENPLYVDLGDINIDDTYFKVDATFGGLDYYDDPDVKYTIYKKHQEGGMLYMQSDTNENLQLKSEVYLKNITMTENDQLVIECKTNLGNDVILTLFSGGKVVRNYTVIEQGNTDFTTQIITLETNQTIQFDQLMFTGNFSEEKYFLVNSIAVLEGASVIDTKLWSYDFTEGDNKPDILPDGGNGAEELTDSSFAHIQDDLYYNISSGFHYNSSSLSVEFEFEIPASEFADVNMVDIKLVGTATSASLGGALYSLRNFDTAEFEVMGKTVEGDLYTFSIPKSQLYKLYNNDSSSYMVVFELKLESSNNFTIHIDSIDVITYEHWAVEHDLYRASFVFERFQSTDVGNVTVAINDEISVTLLDSELYDSGDDNNFTFYYDCYAQVWHGYLNDNLVDYLNISQSDPSINPRIESNYDYQTYPSYGIIVKSIEYQYYKKISNSLDFEKYKSLIDSYKAVHGYADEIVLDSQDSVITPENVFTQACSDVDIIYSFHDEMIADNIFSYELLPTFDSDSFDNLDSYLYNETGFIIISATNIDNVLLDNDKSISLNSSYSHAQQSSTPLDSGIYDDPFFGKNSLHFTLKNCIQTPVFRRDNGSIYVDLELINLDLDFEVYPNPQNSPSYTDFPLEHQNVEGDDETKYDPDVLEDYTEYSTSRFRHSAIDDIQIPLITPIQLDFGNIDANDFADMDLELCLDVDILLQHRAVDSNWSWRFRLVYYNYSLGQWEDFNGILSAKHMGYDRTIWDPTKNFITFLQNPEQNNFLPIFNDNDIYVKNPVLIDGVNNNTIVDGVMKLALISYILPANFTGDENGNYFSYERADPEIPISITQTVDILDCLLIGQTREILYPESSLIVNLELDENFRANLSQIDNLGEIVAVKGRYIDLYEILYEYPIYSYWITADNELAFNSPMKYLFTNVSIEYVPQFSLQYNSTDGAWYLPDEVLFMGYNFTDPFFVSNLYVNNTLYGTYIHPDVDVGYILGSNDTGTFIQFADSVHPDSDVRGSIHFGKINGIYLYRFSLQDELLYRYNVLNEDSALIDGTLHLELNAGFRDIIYSELSQVSCLDYHLFVNISRLNTKSNKLEPIGFTSIDLDKNLLGFHYYNLDISFNDITFLSSGRDKLKEALTRGTNYDLYITLKSSIYNCKVNGHLFKGMYAHELLTASFEIECEESELIFNGDQVQTPYIPISQESIILTKIDTAQYQFDASSLMYEFDFVIDELRTATNTLSENIDYLFNSDQRSISLIGYYRDYSGYLFADITYKAFEWEAGSVSALEPITLTFENDYVKNITKFLELVIQYNGIPGYELEDIDETSGRLVLSDEEKSAALLKIYLYNFVEDKWEKIGFVTYDDYTGTNTFSYVVDRNFITFEDFFNKTVGEEFEIKVVFAVEEIIGDCFTSKAGFSITSIGANIYYDTPDTSHKVNPELEFDIDLTDYYNNTNIYLEEISLDLDYSGEIEFDDAFIFSQYALLEENYNFYLRDQYLEFEVFELEEDSITLSREEIDRLIYHDIENEKYFLRAKLEYDWNCILEMNLGSKSKLEIISTLNLNKYDLFVAYTSYETTRIS
ncbi:MAG: DUF2341 domain-containing protein, partial [Candidatus Helarchaeota archaeon]|nr:DUF2341 domain-containing protein [Candidatus Helarchaeota archaeon]